MEQDAVDGDSVFGELEDQCTCWVCFEVFEEPITLTCSHTLCKDCAEKVQKKTGSCPFCRRAYEPPLPEVNKEVEELVKKYLKIKNDMDVAKDGQPSIQDSWLLNIPEEVLVEILMFLPPKQIGKVSKVSKDLYRVSNDSWLWRDICQRQFPFCSVDKYNKNWKYCFIARSNIHKGWSEGKAGDFDVTTLRGHVNYVNCFRLYRNNIVSGSADSTLKVWKTDSDSPIHTLVGHSGVVTSVEFNEVKIVSGASDSTVKIWDTRTGLTVKTMSHNGSVNQIQFDDTKIVSGSSDTTVKIWDVRDGSATMTMQASSPVTSLSFNGNYVVSLSSDNTIRAFDIRNGSLSRAFQDWSGPTTFKMAGNSNVVAGCRDGTIKFWDISTGTQTAFTGAHHHSPITDLQCDSKKVVTAASDGVIHVWDLSTKTMKNSLSEHKSAVNCLQFDDNKIVSGSADNSIKVWDASNGKRLYSLLGGSLQKRANNPDHPSRLGCSFLHYDDSRIVASFSSLLRVYDFEHYTPPA